MRPLVGLSVVIFYTATLTACKPRRNSTLSEEQGEITVFKSSQEFRDQYREGSCAYTYWNLFNHHGTQKENVIFQRPEFGVTAEESWIAPERVPGRGLAKFRTSRKGSEGIPFDGLEYETLPRLETVLEHVKKIYSETILPELKETHPLIAAQWQHDITHATFSLDGKGSGALFSDPRCTGRYVGLPIADSFMEERQVLYRLKTPDFSQGYRPAGINWSIKRSKGITAAAADVFIMAHELAHATNWAPPEVVKILKNPQGYNAQQTQTMDKTNGDNYVFRPWQLLKVAKSFPKKIDAKILEMVNKWNAQGYVSIHEGFEIRDLVKNFLESLTAKEKENLFTLVDFDYNQGSATHEGYGTEFYAFLMEKFANQTKIDEASIGKLESELPAGVQQLFEAAADYYGTRVTAEFISSNYTNAEDQRAAALTVLASHPPMRYAPRVAKLMNRAGSKQTNEARMLGIYLRDPKIKDLLNCD